MPGKNINTVTSSNFLLKITKSTSQKYFHISCSQKALYVCMLAAGRVTVLVSAASRGSVYSVSALHRWARINPGQNINFFFLQKPLLLSCFTLTDYISLHLPNLFYVESESCLFNGRGNLSLPK